MIRAIDDMPAGTIGFEAVGKVTDDDYRDVLVPAVAKAAESTDGVRLLYVLGEDVSYSARAIWADTTLFGRNARAWQRVAIVSDADWLENAVKAFGWMMPGQIKVFESDDADDARRWLVGGADGEHS